MRHFLSILFFSFISINAQTTVETFVLTGSATGISDNGEIICGYDNSAGQAFYWTEGTGKVFIGSAEAHGVSNDTTIAGRFLDPNTLTNGNPTKVAGYYKNGQWTKLSGIPGVDPLDENSYTHAYSINGDGNKITGMAWEPGYIVEACFWTLPDTGIGLLGRTNNANSRVDDISNDGSVIVGWNGGVGGNPDRTPYYWDPTPHFMGSLDSTWDGGECNGVSPDGHYLVGNSASWAYLYTQNEGMQRIVDPNNGWWNTWCSDVSNNGIVVGHCDLGFFDYRATIWRTGWNDVALVYNYLVDTLGVTGIDDWFPIFNRAISADGTIFCGEMADAGHPFGNATFVVKIINQVPVELTSFTATASGNDIQLNWSTATETNNSGFDVERKWNNSSWQSVGFVPGHGSSTEQHSYSFIDKDLSIGAYSYRLKQVDYDGTFEYSNEIEVEITNPTSFNLAQNYPNPFNPSTTISFSIAQATNVNLEVFNLLGEQVATLVNEVKDAGDYKIDFNASNLTSGIYFYVLEADGMKISKKMILMK